jgi:hypothetical protein
MPVTTPVGLMVATVTGVMLHVPPATALLSDVVAPTHKDSGPVIADGVGVTVTLPVTKYPAGSVRVIVAVPPVMPVTMPAALTVATAVLLDAKVPVPVLLQNLTVLPMHTVLLTVTFRTLLLFRSDMYMLPIASNTAFTGLFIVADVARPPSPEREAPPAPAIVVIMPAVLM